MDSNHLGTAAMAPKHQHCLFAFQQVPTKVRTRVLSAHRSVAKFRTNERAKTRGRIIAAADVCECGRDYCRPAARALP